MRLLLAEDEKSLARAIGTILEKNHYSIDLVYNGRDHCAEKTAEPGDLHTGASAYGKIRG